MRQRVLPIIAGVLIIGALAALAFFGIRAISSKSTTTPVGTGPLQIRVWRLNQDIDPFRPLISKYNDNHQGVVVSYIKGSADTYELDALNSLAAKQGPEIWSIPNDWLGDQQNHILPVPDKFFWPVKTGSGPTADSAVKQLYPPGIAEQLIAPDGKVYGIPMNVDVLKLYYNPKFFDRAIEDFHTSLEKNYSDAVFNPVEQLLSHPPATWTELLQQLPYLTKRASGTFTYSGIALGAADNVPYSEDILQLMMLQNGAEIVSADRQRALFNTPIKTPSGGVVRPGQQALDFFSSFSNTSKTQYSWNASQPQALDAFAQGKLGMVIAYSEFGRQLGIKYPEFSYKIAPVPQISTQQTPVNFIRFTTETVTKDGSSPTYSFDFLSSYTNADAASTIAEEQTLSSPYTQNLTDAANHNDTQAAAILTGRATYKKSRTLFDAAFHQAIVEATQNKVSASDALDQASQVINNILSPIPSPTPNAVRAQ